MRVLTTMAVVAALTVPAAAQSQTAPSWPGETPAPSTDIVGNVAVVDIADLTPDIRLQVDALLEQTSAEDLQALRNSIDATPPTSAALKAKGLTSEDVVAVDVDAMGQLTLITRSSI